MDQDLIGTGSDFLQLDASTAPRRGISDWLHRAVREAILDGTLHGDQPLPSTRQLASDLGIARGVVVEAYDRLADEALIRSVPRAGFRVAAVARGPVERLPEPPTALPQLPSTPYRAPDIEFDLSPGRPDLTAFPRSDWLAAERAVLATTSTASLGYGDPRGTPRLRETLATWLATTRGVRAHADQILIVSGVAQALALITHLAVRRGRARVAVEDPGSRGAHDELRYWGAQLDPVPVDAKGIRAEQLTEHHDLALLTPAHQFPVGVVLAPERRTHVLDWAQRNGAMVIEDDYDADYRFDRSPVPALQASAPDHVLYTGSTSKSLAPAMRLGWLVAPPSRLADLIEAKYTSDLGSPTIPQLVLAELVQSGRYDTHLRRVRTRLRGRRDAAVDAVRRHLPHTQVSGIAAGLHLVLTFERSTIDDALVASRSKEAGVLVQPLSLHRHADGPPGLVIGYATHSAGQLDAAIGRIAGVLR